MLYFISYPSCPSSVEKYAISFCKFKCSESLISIISSMDKLSLETVSSQIKYYSKPVVFRLNR